MPPAAFRARVGAIGRGAAGVVGQREVDLTGFRVDGSPLRPVHLGRANGVCGQSGVDEHVGLAGEQRAVQWALTKDQWQPYARAVVVELGHVQRAFVQQGAIGHTSGFAVHAFRDELVDVFVDGVIAGITDDGLTFHPRLEHHTFMGKTAERRALDGCAVGVEGVEFHHPAKAIRFIAVILRGIGARGGDVEAAVFVGTVVGQLPAVTRSGWAAFGVAHTIAGLFTRTIAWGHLVDEIAGPVFLGHHVGVPRRHAVGAIVQGTAGARAVRTVGGLDEVRATNRTAQGHGGQTGDAAVARVGHHRPLTISLFANPNHRHPVGVQFLQTLVGRPLAVDQCRHGVAVQFLPNRRGVHEARLYILVVHHQQAIGRAALVGVAAFDREKVHAVVVAADLMRLVSPAVGQRIECRHGTTDRGAPGHQGLHFVAGRHQHGVRIADAHRLEADEWACAGRARG